MGCSLSFSFSFLPSPTAALSGAVQNLTCSQHVLRLKDSSPTSATGGFFEGACVDFQNVAKKGRHYTALKLGEVL
jgi:hypothetical protein